jgi:hypothetical protein
LPGCFPGALRTVGPPVLDGKHICNILNLSQSIRCFARLVVALQNILYVADRGSI